MATMDLTRYEDRITGEKVLVIESSRPRKEIFKGMLIGVESKMIGYFESMRKFGWLTKEQYADKIERKIERDVVDLVTTCCLMELDDFTVDDLEEYLKGYLERLKLRLNPKEMEFVETNIEEVENYLIPRIRNSHLKAYTTLESFGDTNASTEGAIAFADTMGKEDQPPTFLYLTFGLREYYYPAVHTQEEDDKLINWAYSFSEDAYGVHVSSEDDNMYCAALELEDDDMYCAAVSESADESSSSQGENDPKMNQLFCLDNDKRRKLAA